MEIKLYISVYLTTNVEVATAEAITAAAIVVASILLIDVVTKFTITIAATALEKMAIRCPFIGMSVKALSSRVQWFQPKRLVTDVKDLLGIFGVWSI